jgi:hypothetical protein
MTRFVVGEDRSQSTLFPERLDDYLAEDNRSGRSMFLSMSLIWPGWALAVSSRRRLEGRPIIRRHC